MIAALIGVVLFAGSELASAQDSPITAAEWYKLGKVQLHQLRFEQARNAVNRAIDLAPGSAPNYILLGECSRELHDYDGAYRAWLTANKLDPADPQAAYYLGRLFYEANVFTEAAAWLRETLRLAPAHYAAMTYLGLSAEALEMSGTAEQLYRAALEQSKLQGKPYSWAWLGLAKLLRQRAKESEAAALLEEGEGLSRCAPVDPLGSGPRDSGSNGACRSRAPPCNPN
ncbi:MAG: tetratricopeptide repeat protein [Bryobacteraceae bacterium]